MIWLKNLGRLAEGEPVVNEFKVLLVDDEEDFVHTLVKRLTRRKLDVRSALSGKEALKLVSDFVPDVIVLDVKMRDMDGIETLKQIKTLCPATEVIMLTGHANVEVAIRGMELGAFDYLMKPIEIDELLYKLQDAYKKKCCNR